MIDNWEIILRESYEIYIIDTADVVNEQNDWNSYVIFTTFILYSIFCDTTWFLYLINFQVYLKKTFRSWFAVQTVIRFCFSYLYPWDIFNNMTISINLAISIIKNIFHMLVHLPEYGKHINHIVYIYDLDEIVGSSNNMN